MSILFTLHMKNQASDKHTKTGFDPPTGTHSHPHKELAYLSDDHDFSSYSSLINNSEHSSTNAIFFPTPVSRSTHWSVAWSDLMMTMFVLFMVMFVYKSADKEFLSGDGLGFASGRHIGNEVRDTTMMGTNNYFQYADKSVSRVYDFSRQLIHQEDIKEFASIDLEADRTLRIVLTGDLLFDLGAVNLKNSARDNLKQVARIIQNTPYIINVIGHTDNQQTNNAYASNWELSALRASSVTRYLIAQTGLPPSHFFVTGHAFHQPAAPNDSPENRAKNRRVEIVLTKLLPLQSESFDSEINENFSPANLSQETQPAPQFLPTEGAH
nr:flagellar motor protein MotB [Desulfobulbaceae bacterium]